MPHPRPGFAARRNKFGNVATVVDGKRFASGREAKRYGELRLLERAGLISGLKLQPRYPLTVNGCPVTVYFGDFDYVEGGQLVTEDSKGVQTDVFKLKAKLFAAIHGREVRLT